MNFNRRDLLLSGSGVAAALTVAGPVLAQNMAPAASAPVAPAPAAPMPGTGSSDVAAYAALTNEKKLNIVTLRDLEAEAQKIIPPYGFAYISGGGGDEWTMRENEAAYNRWVIEPHYLAGVKVPDLTTTILGSKIALPVITAPMGGQGIAHALKEAPDAKGTNAAGTIYVDSSVSNLTMEEIAAAGAGPKWFQIYFPVDRAYAQELLQRAKAAGYTAIVVTLDATTFSNRERPIRLGVVPPNLGSGNVPKTPGINPLTASVQKADLTWDDVAFCKSVTGLPVIVKGVLTPALAAEAVKRGCAGVWVSNHGGRQLDNSPATMTVLPSIVKVVGKRVPIIVDGGIRRGQDVFRALALGADVVALGRPVLYGMALGGAQGVQSVYGRLKTELQMTMQLAGTANIKAITHDYVARAEEA